MHVYKTLYDKLAVIQPTNKPAKIEPKQVRDPMRAAIASEVFEIPNPSEDREDAITTAQTEGRRPEHMTATKLSAESLSHDTKTNFPPNPSSSD